MVPSVFGKAKESLIKAFRGRVDLSGKSGGGGGSSRGVGILSQERIDRAKRMMAPFVLRRRKCQVLRELPPKTVEVRRCVMSPHQAKVYKEVKETSVVTLRAEQMGMGEGKSEGKERGEEQEKGRAKVPNVLMELRKAACHPLLLRSVYDDGTLDQMAREILREEEFTHSEYPYVLEDMEVMSDFQLHQLCCRYPSVRPFRLPEKRWMGSGKVEALREILVKGEEEGDRFLLFSQFTMMLDILESVMETLGVPYLRMDGQTKSTERTDLIDQYNAPDSPYLVFLLSTKAGGFGINLTAANTVILHDMDFNPHNDRQAEDRAHRKSRDQRRKGGKGERWVG